MVVFIDGFHSFRLLCQVSGKTMERPLGVNTIEKSMDSQSGEQSRIDPSRSGQKTSVRFLAGAWIPLPYPLAIFFEQHLSRFANESVNHRYIKWSTVDLKVKNFRISLLRMSKYFSNCRYELSVSIFLSSFSLARDIPTRKEVEQSPYEISRIRLIQLMPIVHTSHSTEVFNEHAIDP